MTGGDGRSLGRIYYEDLLTAGDIDAIERIMHPEITFNGPITPQGLVGHDQYRKFALGWYSGIPDRHFEVAQEWIDGDHIAIQFHITGTHKGEFMGQPPTGNSIDVWGMNFFDIEDGLIRHIQAYFNPLHLLEPVGLVTTQSALELPKKPS